MSFKQFVIEAAVKHFKAMRAAGEDADPETAFLRAREELDWGWDLTDDESEGYLRAIIRACIKSGAYEEVPYRKIPANRVAFEYLPETVLGENFGDWGACEQFWKPMNQAMTKRFLESGHSVALSLSMPCDSFTWKAAKPILEEGCVMHLPIGYLRQKNDHKKCPRCGRSIIDQGALSRLDNKTELCSDCSAREALEESFGSTGD